MNGIAITQYDNFAWLPMVMSAAGNKSAGATGDAGGEKKAGGFDWMSMLSMGGSKPDPAAAQAQATADAIESQNKAARFAGLFDFLKNKNQPAATNKWAGLFQKDNTVKYIVIAASCIAVALLLYFLFKSKKPQA